MERIIRNNNGITLIALVISIIVMLILAGVSINAVVGDNGVISKAQDTVFLNSCAYLEDYFNQLYATLIIDGEEERETPLDTIMRSGYTNYFFSTSAGTCLKKVYNNEETGESQTLVLYLVKKEQLPEGIQAQLTGAEDLESRDYRKLRGCYGITSDLKAYYCEDGLESIIKLELSDLNADSPDIVFAEQDSVLANVVNGGTAPVTNQGLKTIKTLTIDSTEELTLLDNFTKFTNLTTVEFVNLNIENLNGIEGAANTITQVKFTSCNVQNYSALNNLSKLTQLYLIAPAGKNEDVARLGSAENGIANAEFANLQYFGIVGDKTYLNTIPDKNRPASGTRYAITDISSLANFSDTTKKAIKYMNLQNLQLTSIAALADFTNVYLLRVEYNNLYTLEGIQNMNKLKYLMAVSESYLGKNEGDVATTTDALDYIYKDENGKNKILYYLALDNAPIKYVDSLADCTAISYLYLNECNYIKNVSTISTVLGNCGANYLLNGAYGLEIIGDTTKVLSLSGKTMTISEFEQLKNKTALTHLNLNGITITDNSGVTLTQTTTPTLNEEINNVLSTCINLQYLRLSNISNLTTIDFVGENKCTKLRELDLRNTGVTDLTNLNNYALSLSTIYINNASIDITAIQSTINRCWGTNYYWNGTASGACLTSWDLISQLEDCENLTSFRSYIDVTAITKNKVLDLSSTKLTKISITYYHCTVTYPKTIISIINDYCKSPLFVEGTDKLTSLTFTWNRKLSSATEWENTMKSIANVTNLQSLNISNTLNFKVEYLKYLKDLQYLTTFSMADNGDNEIYAVGKTSLKGIENLKYLTTINIEKEKYLTDISDLASCKNLTTVKICGCKELTDVSSIKALTNLTKLELFSNKINDVNFVSTLTSLVELNLNNNIINNVYPLLSCTSLQTLHIQNNALSDYSTHTTATGQNIAYETMDVFYDLNHAKKGALKNLYIYGNNFDDTEILLDLTWDAKSGF